MPILDWFITNTGKQVSSGLVLAASCGVAGFYTAANTILLGKYQDFVQMYRCGTPLEVDPDVMKQVQEVLDECKLKEKDRSAFSFFTVLGFDTFHAGSTKLNCGARIGIPHHFAYRHVNQVERTDLLVGGTSVAAATEAAIVAADTSDKTTATTPQAFSFNSETGRALLDSLVLSDRAQRFAMAREIHASTTNYVYVRSTLSAFSVILAYSLGKYVNQRFNLYQLRRGFRVTLYSLTGMFGLITYFMLYDATTLAYERLADKAVSRMGPDYAQGALEYYTKELARNRALRVALGEAGVKQYTLSGNLEVGLRTRTTPLTVRLDQAKEFVAGWAEKSQTVVPEVKPVVASEPEKK